MAQPLAQRGLGWWDRRVDLASKLQLKRGARAALVGVPPDIDLGLLEMSEVADLADADAVIAFVTDGESLQRLRLQIVGAVARDALVWVAYPKAGQLGTDLNRDLLARVLLDDGVRPVRQISVDQVWSALRFRPA